MAVMIYFFLLFIIIIIIIIIFIIIIIVSYVYLYLFLIWYDWILSLKPSSRLLIPLEIMLCNPMWPQVKKQEKI